MAFSFIQQRTDPSLQSGSLTKKSCTKFSEIFCSQCTIYNLLKQLKSILFSQNLPKIYSFGSKCQKCSLRIYIFCEIKLQILQLKLYQIYNLQSPEERGEQVKVNSGHYVHLQHPKAACANQLEICSGVHSVLKYAPIKMSENRISLKLNNPFINWSEPLVCAVTEISVHY